MLNLPGEKLNLSAPITAIFGSKGGCLHVESAFLAVGEAACTSSRSSTGSTCVWPRSLHPYSPHGSTRLSIRLQSPASRFGLVW